MKQYFAYIRVSTVKQGERGSSLQEQKSAIEAYAAHHALSIASWFEEKETAAKLGRTVFTRMLAELERGAAAGLIVHKIDRSARNLKDWANLGSLIDRGIDVHFAHDSLDLRSRGGRLSADLQAVIAADYIRNLREEVQKGIRGRLKQGVYPFAAPIGYLDMGKGGRLKIPDPVRAPLVRYAFERYATGLIGLKDLRLELAHRGLTSVRSGKALSLCGVSTVLNNPFYMGLIHIKRTNETYRGKHEPLIEKALFERVQKILKGKLVARIYKHDYLFRKMVTCAACGRRLIGERHKTYYVYYRCQTCRRTSVREELLDHEVQMALKTIQWSDREQREAALIVEELKARAGEDIERVRQGLVLRLGKLDERLTRLTDVYLDGAMDKETFERRKRALLTEERGVQDSLADLSREVSPGERAFEKLELGNAAYLGYRNGNRQERRDIVSAVTSNFLLHGKNPAFELCSPFREVSNWRKSLQSAHRRLTPRQSAQQLLDIAVAVVEAERKALAAEKIKMTDANRLSE